MTRRRRLALLCAVPPGLYLLASVTFFVALVAWGGPRWSNQQRIAAVIAGSAAEKAGLRQGDALGSIDGERVGVDRPVRSIVDRGRGRPVVVRFERDGATRELVVTPDPDGEHWRVGLQLMPMLACEPWPIGRVVAESLVSPARQLVRLFALARVAVGPRTEVSGPVGITRAGGDRSPCERRWSAVGLVEMALALCSALSAFVPLGFAISAARGRARGRPVA